MNIDLSRRQMMGLLGAGLASFFSINAAAAPPHNFRIRTITAGIDLQEPGNLQSAESAITFLQQARAIYISQGYEVQTLRLATPPLAQYLPNWMASSSMERLKVLDQFAVKHNVACSIGPIITDDRYLPEFAVWATELVQQTRNLSFTLSVASSTHGVHRQTLRMAAETIHAIAGATAGGEGNFRFAATGFIPAGTPFFPAAYFSNANSFSIGLESPNLLRDAFAGTGEIKQAQYKLAGSLQAAMAPIAAQADALARKNDWHYLGIDASPAPGLDASIGQAIETLTGAPFGSASTLAACAAITDVLKALPVKTCGFSGLMLPVLEDIVLAQRAAEGRYSVSELLLYSSVCGTGLDVVPLPGDTSVEALAATIADVAALSTRYRKPLSARLFPIPGKQAGDKVSFDNPHLADAVVMPL